jgi:RNA polymerase sigma-70 factor (ECF subfamily)
MHQNRVKTLAYRILGNEEDAADIQQETFISAWKNLRKFRGDADIATWLHSITVNLCISWKRRRDRVVCEPEIEDLACDTPSLSPTSVIERTERIQTVRRILSAMPAHYRVLIVLRDMEERSFEEIAAIMGCSEGSVRSRLCRARSLFREKMLPYLTEE